MKNEEKQLTIGIDIRNIGKKVEDIDFNALVSGIKREVVNLMRATGQAPTVTLDDFDDIEIETQTENLSEIVIEEDTSPTIPRFEEEEMLEMIWKKLNQEGQNSTGDVHDMIMADIKRDNPYLADNYLFMGDGIPTHKEVNEAFALVSKTLGITQAILASRSQGHQGSDIKQLALFLTDPLTWEDFKALL